MSQNMNLNRRAFITGAGVIAGAVLSNGGLPSWLVGARFQDLTYLDALRLLDLSLSPEQRAYTVLPLADPSRQVSNTVAIHKGPHIGTLFDSNQQALIYRIYQTMLSQQGQQWLQNTISLEGKFSGSSFKLYTDQNAGNLANGRTQAMVNGGHYLLRSEISDNPYALGGPMAYGQELGNGRFKVQGNAFKAHGDAVNEFVQTLSDNERNQAYQPTPPMELVLQIQGVNGNFSGLRFGNTSIETRELAKHMLATLFSIYPQQQQRDAFSAIEENGGIESLYLSLYRDSSYYPDGMSLTELCTTQLRQRTLAYTQIWRIEGPASVIHFKGYPHVHAYMNIVRDPKRAAIGEQLARLDKVTGEDQIQALMHESLKQSTGEHLAFYPKSIVGRLSPGPITTGSIYSLEPFNNKIVVVDILGQAMSRELTGEVNRQGSAVEYGKTYRIATIDYMLQDRAQFGEAEQVVTYGGSLRESVIAGLRQNEHSLFA